MGSTSLTAPSDLDLLPDVLLSLQEFKKMFQACLGPWVLRAVATTEKSKHVPVLFLCTIIFLAFVHEVLLSHLQNIAEEIQVTCSRGTGSTVLQLMYYKKWVVFPLFIFSRPRLTLFISFILSLVRFFSKLKSHRKEAVPHLRPCSYSLIQIFL